MGRAVLCPPPPSNDSLQCGRNYPFALSCCNLLFVTSKLPFEQRACFVAGQAKSGTTLLVALLDSHPELLVLPEETAYFPTVLTKYAPRGRRAQFDYLTKQSLSNVLFGGPCKWGKRSYETFPREKFLQTFEHAAFDPANAQDDLLVLMVKAYAAALGRSLDTVTRWVEKTPANRNHVRTIIERFPHAKILITLRDPRAILATMLVTYLCLIYAGKLSDKLGAMGIDAITRIVGFFVSAIGVGLIFDGVIEALESHGVTTLH